MKRDSTGVRVLVTNDDGIASPGLATLAEAAAEIGLDVVVAAPDSERSGASASLSALQADGRVILREHDLNGLRAVAVEASPAFIVFIAMRGAFGSPPQLVLSGINQGPNTGQAVLHSGTVGAALTASTYGVGALAISLAAAGPHPNLATASCVAKKAIEWLLSSELAVVLNVNVPDVPPEELKGLCAAPLAEFGAVQAEIGERGEGFVSVTLSEVLARGDKVSDATLLAQGWATCTVLEAPCHRADVDLSALINS